MLSLATLPAALLLAATSIALGTGTPVTQAPIAGQEHVHVSGWHVAGVSDPDPADCPLCGGNPTLHVKVLWQIQKYAASGIVARLL